MNAVFNPSESAVDLKPINKAKNTAKKAVVMAIPIEVIIALFFELDVILLFFVFIISISLLTTQCTRIDFP